MVYKLFIWQLWVSILFTVPIVSTAQNQLFFSINAGKYFTVLFPGFSTGNKYNPYRFTTVPQQSYDLILTQPPSRYKLNKQISAGLYISPHSYLSIAYRYFESVGGLLCNHYFVYFAHTASLAFNREYPLLDERVYFLNSYQLSFQYGYTRGGLSSFTDIETCPYIAHPEPPPQVRVSALGIGYAPAIHVRLWHTFFATLNAETVLYLIGKNAGFQPLQLHLMVGLAWKPQLKRPEEAGN